MDKAFPSFLFVCLFNRIRFLLLQGPGDAFTVSANTDFIVA